MGRAALATANLEETLRRTRALVEAARLISASGHDLDAVLDALTDQAIKLFEADAGSLYLADRDGYLVVRRPSPLAVPGSLFAVRGTRFRPGGHTGQAIAEHRATFAMDYRSDERIDPSVRRQFPDIAANLVVPLFAGDELVGTLHLAWRRPHALTPEDLEVAEALGAHAAVAIRSAHLVERIREDANRTEGAQATTAALSSALTSEQVAEVIIQGAITCIGARSGVVGVLSGDQREIELLQAVGFPEAVVQPWRRFSVDAPVPIADVIRFREPIIIESAAEVSARYPALNEVHVLTGHGALAALPLAIPSGVIGALSLSFAEDRRIDPSEWRWIVSLAQRCAMALDRARLYEEARRSDERYRMVAEAASVAIWEWDATTGEVLWTGGGREVFGYAPTDNTVDLSWWIDRVHPDDRVRIGAIRREAIERNAPGWTYEYRFRRADGSYAPCVAVARVLSRRKGQIERTIGMVMDASRIRQAEEERDRLAEALVRAEERRRVAMDLHDGVIQQLFGASMLLMGLQRRTGMLTEDAREALHTAVAAVESAHSTIRDYMESLRSPVLPRGGLREQLEALAQDVRGALGLVVELHMAPNAEDPLAPTAVTEVLHIAREAAANAVRHGGATTMAIQVKRTAKRLSVVLRDNGKGFATLAVPHASGHGLANMAERARRLGGTLRVASTPGQGAEIRLELPLAGEAAPPANGEVASPIGR